MTIKLGCSLAFGALSRLFAIGLIVAAQSSGAAAAGWTSHPALSRHVRAVAAVSEGSLEGLLTAIVTWLSANLDLPAVYDHPRVAFAPQREITAMHLAAADAETWSEVLADGSRNEIVSVYSTASRTIFLQDNWTGTSAAELSILVHEMVHHLQTVGGLRYACPAARERPAYKAQALALAQFGTSLKEAFGIDEMTLLVRTTCVP